MLTGARSRPGTRQRGVVLFISLIMLVAMTLAGIALVRSIYTSNLIAGNLAFQQSAVLASERGMEAAIKWLENNNTTATAATLYSDVPAQGYFSSRVGGSPVNQSWQDFWDANLVPVGVVSVAADSYGSGNSVQYVIHRLCDKANTSPTSGNYCSLSPQTVGSAGSSHGSGVVSLQYSNQVYYRITVRVAGPRNTVSFTQEVVAL
jgi:type IV pilus assembly protein PilX